MINTQRVKIYKIYTGIKVLCQNGLKKIIPLESFWSPWQPTKHDFLTLYIWHCYYIFIELSNRVYIVLIENDDDDGFHNDKDNGTCHCTSKSGTNQS